LQRGYISLESEKHPPDDNWDTRALSIIIAFGNYMGRRGHVLYIVEKDTKRRDCIKSIAALSLLFPLGSKNGLISSNFDSSWACTVRVIPLERKRG
jgi:hypothetical protein